MSDDNKITFAKKKPVKLSDYVDTQKVTVDGGSSVLVPVNSEANQSMMQVIVATAAEKWMEQAALVKEMTGKELKDYMESAKALISMSKEVWPDGAAPASETPSSAVISAMAKGMVEGVSKQLSLREKADALKAEKAAAPEIKAEKL